jgi:thiamine-phosphate pyrophosphorylase
MVFLAGSPEMAQRWRADGVHGHIVRRSTIGGLLHSAPVHDVRQIQQTNRSGADIFFLSPVFATRSHPGQRPLNPVQLRYLAGLCNGTVIYLGGMNRQRYRTRKNHRAHGWAAIDALR